MPAIHFVERLKNYNCVSSEQNEWESGYWNVTPETAGKLVNGDIYLHDGQNAPSHFGGVITGFRIATEKDSSRIIFRFRSRETHQGVTTAKEGWGNEQKRTWD